jgi:hypothetical protein
MSFPPLYVFVHVFEHKNTHAQNHNAGIRGKFDMDAMKDAVAKHKSKFYLTLFRFQFATLMLPYFNHRDKAIIVAGWPGMPGMTTTFSVNETEFFRMSDMNDKEKKKAKKSIIVHVVGIKGFTDFSGFVDKTDPYVKLTYYGREFKTRTATNIGGTASIDEMFEIPWNRGSNKMTVSVFDEDTMQDDVLGQVEIDLTNQFFSLSTPIIDQAVNFNCMKNGKVAGSIKLAFAKTEADMEISSSTSSHLIGVFKGLDLPIMTPASMKWSQLPPIEIQIYLLSPETYLEANKDIKNKIKQAELGSGALKEGMARAFLRREKVTKAAVVGSFSFPKAQPALATKVSLEDLIKIRTTGVKTAAGKVNLTSWNQREQGYTGELEMSVYVSRKPLTDAFPKLMNAIRYRGMNAPATDYFMQKLTTIVDGVEAKNNEFLDACRERRIALLKSVSKSLAKSGKGGMAAAAVFQIKHNDRDVEQIELQGTFQTTVTALKVQQEKVSSNKTEIAELTKVVSSIQKLFAAAEQIALGAQRAQQNNPQEVNHLRNEELKVQPLVDAARELESQRKLPGEGSLPALQSQSQPLFAPRNSGLSPV